MSVEDLYKEILLEHYTHPHNHGKIENDNIIAAEGENPLCGDHVNLYLKIKDNKIEDIKFDGAGCSISIASTSMLTEAVKGKSVKEAMEIINRFVKVMHNEEDEEVLEEIYDDLESLTGVKKFPVRVKCALLSWKTLEEKIKNIE